MKWLLQGTGLIAVLGVVIVIATLVGAVLAGPTVAAGERAVVVLGLLDLALALAAAVVFFVLGRGVAPLPRVLGTLAFVVVEVALLAMLGLVTLVMFNR